MILRGSLYSSVLEMDTGITVITPNEPKPGETPQVAYLLHGLGANNGSWTESSLLPEYARAHNVTFIMPEVGRSYYIDQRYGQRFFTYVADELPALCAAAFNIAAKREDTAVMGGSMGGYGALKCGLSRAERFGTCCAFAAGGLYQREYVEKIKRIGDWKRVECMLGRQRVMDYRAMFGDDLVIPPEDELSDVAQTAASAEARPRLFCCCGTEDPFFRNNVRFRDELAGLGFAPVWEEWSGGHDWTFFDAALRRALLFCYGEGTPHEIAIVTL